MDFFGVADDDGVGAEIEGELHVAVVVQEQVAGELQAAVCAAPAGVPLVVVHIFGFISVGYDGAAEGDARAAGVVAARGFDAADPLVGGFEGNVDFGQEHGLAFV